MGADLFESYSGSIIAPMAFTAFAFASGWVPENAGQFDLILFPFVVAFVGMIGSIIGSFTVRSSGSSEIKDCLLYTSPSPRDATLSRMPSSA